MLREGRLSLCKKRHQKAACMRWRCWTGRCFPATSGQPKELLVKHCPKVHRWLWNKLQNIAAPCLSCPRCSIPTWGRARGAEQVQGWSRYKDGAGTRMEELLPLQHSHQLPVPRNKTCAGVHQENATEGLTCHNRSFLQFTGFLQVLEYLSRGLVIAGSVRSSLGGDFNFGCRDG